MDQDDKQDEIVQLEQADCVEGLSHNFFHFTTDLLSSHAYISYY